MNTRARFFMIAAVFAMGVGFFFSPRAAVAHCDTLDGPVVKEAKAALEKGGCGAGP